jgi:hypothetical protein
LAKELLKPALRVLLAPMVRAYAEARIRGYVRAIENVAGRDGESMISSSVKGDTASAPPSPLNARQALLRESVWIPGGAGLVLYADLTVEMAQRRIDYMNGVLEGAAKSIRWLRAVIGAIERAGVETFGEVPLDDQLFPEPPAD